MAIGTKEHALVCLVPCSFPRSGKAFGGDPKFLRCTINMMEVERNRASFVATENTLTALVFNDHCLNLLSTLGNGLDDILGSTRVFSLFWHTWSVYQAGCKCTANCSTAELPRTVLRSGLHQSFERRDKSFFHFLALPKLGRKFERRRELRRNGEAEEV